MVNIDIVYRYFQTLVIIIMVNSFQIFSFVIMTIIMDGKTLTYMYI